MVEPRKLLDEQIHNSVRLAELERENARLARVIYDEAHRAATLGSGSTGWLRGRFMSISNALNAAIGRTQSSHGDQYDPTSGLLVKSDETKS